MCKPLVYNNLPLMAAAGYSVRTQPDFHTSAICPDVLLSSIHQDTFETCNQTYPEAMLNLHMAVAWILVAANMGSSSKFALPRMLTVAAMCAKMSRPPACSANRGYDVGWEQLKKDLLDLPDSSKPGEDPLLARIRRLIGNLYWEDVYPEIDPQSAAALYLFKKVADDVFFNFGQDSSTSLDLKLDNGREAIHHVEEVLTPLVRFIQTSLSNEPWEEATKYLREAAAKYLELISRFSEYARLVA